MVLALDNCGELMAHDIAEGMDVFTKLECQQASLDGTVHDVGEPSRIEAARAAYGSRLREQALQLSMPLEEEAVIVEDVPTVPTQPIP